MLHLPSKKSHLEVEDGRLCVLCSFQLSTVDRVNDGTRVCDAHALAHTILAASPACRQYNGILMLAYL
jgi:hypothetical protein